MTDSEPETVIEEYAHNCRIVNEEREDDYNKYHYEEPIGRINIFENPDKTRLYADVQTVTGGFREEKPCAPPAVAQSREDVLMAYYAAQPTMSIQ